MGGGTPRGGHQDPRSSYAQTAIDEWARTEMGPCKCAASRNGGETQCRRGQASQRRCRAPLCKSRQRGKTTVWAAHPKRHGPHYMRRQRRHALKAEGIQPSHCSLPIINQHAFSCFPQINTITNDPVYVLVVLLHLKEEQYSFVLLEIDLPNSKILIQKKNRGKWPGRPARRR